MLKIKKYLPSKLILFFLIFITVIIWQHGSNSGKIVGNNAEKNNKMILKIDNDSYPLMIANIIRNIPDYNKFLNNLFLEGIKSPYKEKKDLGWKTLEIVWKYSDTENALYFTRFCWFKIKEDPLLFYHRYLEGDTYALEFYRIASAYDFIAFEEEDKINQVEFFNAFSRVKREVTKYNEENDINNEAPKYISEIISKAKKYLKSLK